MTSKGQGDVESWRQAIQNGWSNDEILFAHHNLDAQPPVNVLQDLEFYDDNSDSLTSDVKIDDTDLQYCQNDEIQIDGLLQKWSDQVQGSLAPLTVLVPALSTPPESSSDSSLKRRSMPSTKPSQLRSFPEIPSLKSAINAKLSEISELRKLHRRAQNRNAQRAFRERKEQALRENAVQLGSLYAKLEQKDAVIKESEIRVQILQEDVGRLEATVRRLEQAIMRLMCEHNGETAAAAIVSEFVEDKSAVSGGESREFQDIT